MFGSIDKSKGLLFCTHDLDQSLRYAVQQMRQEALRLLGDALDVLRSDWDEDHGPTSAQSLALDEARHHIGRAKAHLDRAAR